MSKIAEILKQTMEREQKSIAEVAEDLNIPLNRLVEIEKGDNMTKDEEEVIRAYIGYYID